MSNFWDFSSWGFFNLTAVLLLGLMLGNMLKRSVPVLQASLIPTSVLGGGILLVISSIYKAITGAEFFDTPFFGGNGTAWLELLTYHMLALGFTASALKTNEGRMTKERSVEIFNTGLTTVATYLLQALLGMVICIVGARYLKDLLEAAGLLLALALLAGYDTTVGYYATVSRFFVYLPWFLLGYYSQRYEAQLRPRLSRHGCLLLAGCVLMIGVSLLYLHKADFPRDALFGSYPYENKGYGLPDRLMFVLIGLAWLGLLWKLFTGVLDRHIPLLTTLGQNTLPVFLLHGFVIKAIPKRIPWAQQLPGLALWLPILLLLLFGNPLIGKIFRMFFTLSGKKGGKS